MKKKFLLLSLLSLTCGFTLAGVGCADEPADSSSAEKNSYTVTFVEGEGFSYEGVIFDTATLQTSEETESTSAQTSEEPQNAKSVTVEEGDTLSFSLDVGAFYAGTPVVLAGDTALASAEGVYTVKVTADTTITVNGITKDVSSMVGTGAFDNAFVVSRPIDLLYIAERVNAGDVTYSKAAYVLGNDIDCKGEELEIIGDLNNDQAFFSGCFSCYTNSETNEMERYTISNFTINSDDSNYVGLFGCVQADLTTTSSGLFYGIRLDNFTINAGTNGLPDNNATVYCGSLIGYGVGVSAYLCDATNGEINVHADDNYFSFAGGLMGCQQGSYASEYGQSYSSEIAYCTVDVDVVCVQGTVLYGGGVVAYAFTDNLVAPAFIHNAYSTGNVSGAVRAGGVAGGLGQYTSVSNCYTTGNIYASANQTVELVSDEEYCYAYAGGLVGFAENDTIVNDSFTAGTTYSRAVAGASYQKTGAAVGGGNETAFVSVNSQKYVELNCLSGVTVDKVAESAQALGWREHDWTLAENAYPVINYEPAAAAITVVTLKYVNAAGEPVKVNGEETNADLQYKDTYAPLIDAFNSGDLNVYVTSDTGLLSYGYFFEDGSPVPYSYLTTRNVTLVVKFTDPTPIVGNYSLVTDEGAIELTLKKDGTAHYTDGTVKQTANYQYDGKVILLESVKFAKFYTGEVDSTLSVNEDTLFDMNRYNYLNFNAIPDENGTLKLYDGTYYTESAPLLAYKTDTTGARELVHAQRYADENGTRVYYTFRANGNGEFVVNGISTAFTYVKAGDTVTLTYAGETETLSFSALLSYDTFKGAWTKSTSVGKTYAFDGEGGWTYTYGKQTTRGAYTVSQDGTKLTLDSGETVSFTLDGFLCVEKNGVQETYYPANSFAAKWQDAKGNLTLQLYGLTTDGAGKGKITYRDGYSYELIYEPSATDGYICLYLLQTSGTDTYKVIFGYFNANSATLNATLYDPYAYDFAYGAESGYGVFTLRLVDEYEGEWISGDELFPLIDFNGAGNFGGFITIGDKKIPYELTDNTLHGTFSYNGVEYALHFDENGKLVQITSPDKSVTLQRKDELANTKFIGFNTKTFTANGSYAFNGAGNLAGGGKLTVTATDGTVSEYLYTKTAENGYTLYSEAIDETKIVGSVVKANGCYQLSVNGSTTELYVENAFMGEWAMSAAFDTLKIGPTDVDGYILGNYLGTNVRIEVLSNTQMQFSCEIEHMPRTFYVFLFGENNDCIALTEYASLSYNDYTLCSRVDEMFGVWTMADKDFTVSFDGLSFPDGSRYGYGTAHISYAGNPTAYNYLLYSDGTALLWSQELQFNSTKYYKWIACEKTDADAYVKGDRAYKRVEVDSLYRTTAKDANGVEYTFDGGNVNGASGTITASDGATYSYKITAYANSKATLTVTNQATGVVYTATLDYSNAANVTIAFEEQTATEAA